MAPNADLTLFLDLGSLFTKARCTGRRARRFRFPSVMAHELLDESAARGRLLLSGADLPRSETFDPARHPRLRSYPGKREELAAARARGHPAKGARFAGRMAALYGADRVTLGERPTEDVVDALVHKALLKSASGCRRVEVVYAVDEGPLAAAVERYAASPRRIEMLRWTFDRDEPEPMRLEVTGRVVDAATCIAAALPERAGRTLALDVGYEKTLVALLDPSGCLRQERLDALGYSDCVRRVLRDGQEQELIEDELAVIWALERADRVIDIAGRRFDVGAMVDRAADALVGEVVRAARRVLLEEFGRSAEPCRAVALTGGGSAALGDSLEARLRELDVGLETVVRAPEPSYVVVDGATRDRGAR